MRDIENIIDFIAMSVAPIIGSNHTVKTMNSRSILFCLIQLYI